MSNETPKTLTYAAAVLLTAAAAITAAVALSSLARPPEFAARMAKVDEQVVSLEAFSKGPAPRSSYGRDAACSSVDDAQLAALEQRLRSMITGSGASVTLLTLTPTELGNGPLTPLRLRLEANGPYAQVASSLGALSNAEPRIFVDRLDLREAGGATQMSMLSKVYCWRDARS